MQLPALSIRQPNIAGIAAFAGRQKQQQFQNRLAQDQGDRANRLLDLKEGRYADEQELTGRIDQARGDYLGGDKSALAKLARIDPDGAVKIQDMVAQASTEQREVLSRQNLEMGQMAHYIMTAQGTEEQAARWQQVRSSSPEIAAAMPETFDQNWADMQVARIMTTEELLKAEENAPSGFRNVGGGLEFIPGGPGDPEYKGDVAEATRADQKPMWVLDTKTNKPIRATDDEIASSGGALTKIPTGMKMTIGADGEVTFASGDMASGTGMSKSTRTMIEKKLFNANEGIARLEAINGRFKPEYQQIGTRWDALKTRWKEKLDLKVSADDLAVLEDFSAYKRDGISNINLYIKEITGAQMSKEEAARIIKGMADPGTGIFDGDSPTEFRSKMNATFKDLRLATARYNYALNKGIAWKDMSLKSIEAIMRKRMYEIEDAVLQESPDATPETLRAEISQVLDAEFGLGQKGP